jgi:hypothetical protein
VAELFGCSGVGVAELAGPVDEVALGARAGLFGVVGWGVGEGAGGAGREPPVLAAAQDDVGLGVLEVLAGDLVLARAVGGAGEERSGAGVGDLGGADQAVALPASLAC